jgi:YgiT-type zinc finger domain-containing protein
VPGSELWRTWYILSEIGRLAGVFNNQGDKDMNKDGQECPICGLAKLERKVVDETFEYKGHSLVVPDYIIFHCAVCEDSLVDRESARTSQIVLKEFFHRVDSLSLD